MNEKMKKKLLLVDGHGLAFRGFYALPPMNAADGTPTNAIVGFFGMLAKALDEWEPDGVALFFDPKGPTKRNELYADYKEGRRPTPDEFKLQMPILLELAEALGFPVIIENGIEADDVIASTGVAAVAEDCNVIVLSADKDLFQLIRPGLTIARPSKGISEMKLYDDALFASEYGFQPSSMADYLALVGDSVDNIPGVSGVGEKTAKALLADRGSLDEIYAHLDDLPPKRRALLENGRETAYHSKTLVVPIETPPVPVEKIMRCEIDHSRAFAICSKYALKQIVSRWGVDASFAPSAVEEASGAEYREVPFGEIANAGELAFVCEFWGEGSRRKALLSSLVTRDGRWCDWRDYDSPPSGVLLVSDLKKLCGFSGAWGNMPSEKIWDAELAHYFLHPDAKSHELGMFFGGRTTNGVESSRDLFAAYDVAKASPHWPAMREIMTSIDAPLSPVLASLQATGIGIDAAGIKTLETELSARVAGIESSIAERAGEKINLNSPKQVGALLFERMGLPAIKKNKTGYSTDVAVLEELSLLPEPLNALPKMMLEFRECSKLLTGFVHPYRCYAEVGDGRVHSSFDHTSTGTGRLSSHEPNVQNIPVFGEWAGRFRSCIVPGEGRVFVAADYSQIELRVLAHFCGEKRLIDAFAQGRDIHLETASWVFDLPSEDVTPEQRRFAKVVNFGLIYGMSAHGLAQRMGISRPQAASMIDRYFAVLPRVRDYIKQSCDEAKERGYTVSLFGRIRPLKEVTTVEGRGAGSLDRVAINTPLQSTAADIAKIAMIRMDGTLRKKFTDARLVLQVHDSLICECNTGAAEEVERTLVETMEGVSVLKVPLKADSKRGNSLAAI